MVRASVGEGIFKALIIVCLNIISILCIEIAYQLAVLDSCITMQCLCTWTSLENTFHTVFSISSFSLKVVLLNHIKVNLYK